MANLNEKTNLNEKLYNAFEKEEKFLWKNSCEKLIGCFKSYSQVSGPKLINIS